MYAGHNSVAHHHALPITMLYTGLRGLQGSGDSVAPTPELALGGSDHGGDSADELLEADPVHVEVGDCPSDLQDVVLGPGRRLLNLCYECASGLASVCMHRVADMPRLPVAQQV